MRAIRGQYGSPPISPINADGNYDVEPVNRMVRPFLLIASIAGFTGVALGAFAAHFLETRIAPDLFEVFEVGVRYQMYHALALIGAAWLASQRPSRAVAWAGRLFTIGIIIFSGSLYLLALTGARWLGAVTPIGGVAFLAGWAALAIAAWKQPRQ